MKLDMRTLAKFYVVYCVCMDADVFLNIFGSLTPSANGRTGIVNNPVMFCFTAALVLGTAWLFVRTFRGSSTTLINNAWFLGLYSWSSLSILWSESRSTILRASPLIWAFLLCGVIASRYLDVEEVVDLLCKAVVFLALLSIVFQLFFPVRQTMAPGWTGVYGEKNHLGIGMGVGIIAQLASPRRWTRMRILATVLFVVMLCLSQSTTSMIFTASATIVYGIMRLKSRARPFAIASLGTTLLMGLLFIPHLVERSLAVAGKTTTLTGRDVIWQLTWQQWMTRPLLGFGFVSFWETQDDLIQQELGWNPRQAHNGFMEMGVTLGAVGVILLLGVLISGGLLAARAWRRGHRTAALWLTLSMVAMLVDNITEADFMIPGPLWFAFCLVSFLTYAELRRGASAKAAPAPSSPRALNTLPVPA